MRYVILYPCVSLLAFCGLASGSKLKNFISDQCSDGQDFLNGACRECNLEDGLCKHSSCTVFGLKNSQQHSCTIGSHSNCPNSACGWMNPTCPSAGRHCYGRVVCSNPDDTCTGLGELCVQNGNSENSFKICPATDPNLSPSSSPSAQISDSPSPSSSAQISDSPSPSPNNGECTMIKVTVLTDYFPDEMGWSIPGTEYGSTEEYTMLQTFYYMDICLLPGTYYLHVTDGFGDGWSVGWPWGYIELTTAIGELVVRIDGSGWWFDKDEQFTIDPTV